MTEAYENLDSEQTEETEVVGDGGVETTELETPSDEDKAVKAQKAIDERIAKKHSQFLQATEWNRAVEEEYRKTKEELDKYKANDDVVIVPPMPDVELAYDDPEKYNAQIKAREDAIIKQSEINYRKQHEEQVRNDNLRQQEINTAKQYQEKVDTYFERAKASGADEETMVKFGQALYIQGLKKFSALENYLITDDNGPALVQAIAKDPELSEKVFSMDDVNAAVYLATKVSPNLKKNNKSLPPPEEHIDGSAPSTEDPRTRGWKTY